MLRSGMMRAACKRGRLRPSSTQRTALRREKGSPIARSIPRTLLQGRPEARYPSAAALEAELRRSLAALGTPYGATEAVAEVRRLSAQARLHKDVGGPTAEDSASITRKLSADYLITAPGSSA
jgi:hypothetical protein